MMVPKHRGKPGPHPWPRAGFVAVVSAELQDVVFLDERLIELLPASEPNMNEAVVLRRTGEQYWLTASEVGTLRIELQMLSEHVESQDERT